MVKWRLLCSLLVVFVTASAALAQKAPRGRMDRDRIHLIKLWKMVDELEVDEEQATTLFPVWSKHERERKSILARRKQATQALAQILVDSDSDDKIADQLDKVRGVDDELQLLDQNFRQRLGGILSIRQEARLLLFKDRFRTDLRGLVRDFQGMRTRREKRGPPNWQERN